MRRIGLIIGLTALAGPALAADPATIDWSNVPVASVTLFYPGQSSYEWLRTSDHGAQSPYWIERPAPHATETGKRRPATRSSRAPAGANAGQGKTAPSI